MQNEGGFHFEVPTEEPKTPEQQPEQVQEKAVEKQRPAAQEAGVAKRASQPGSATTDITQLPPSTPAQPADDQAQKPAAKSAATDDLKAADADLIEKEWIERAKSIVAKTRDDPHRQKSEMSKAKADYIQKRFNKIIKTDDTVAA